MERVERRKIGISRMSSLKAKSMVMRPSGLEKLCKVYGVNPADTSLGWKALWAKAMATK